MSRADRRERLNADCTPGPGSAFNAPGPGTNPPQAIEQIDRDETEIRMFRTLDLNYSEYALDVGLGELARVVGAALTMVDDHRDVPDCRAPLLAVLRLINGDRAAA